MENTYDPTRNFISRFGQNWVMAGAISGLLASGLKAAIDSLTTRTGFSSVRSAEVTRRAIFGKPKMPITAIAKRGRAFAGAISGFGIEALLGAVLGTGISFVSGRTRPSRSLLAGALIGAGVGALTMGVAGVRRTGVFQKKPYQTAGSLLATSGLVGALTGWALSMINRSQPLMSMAQEAIQAFDNDRPLEDRPAEFVH